MGKIYNLYLVEQLNARDEKYLIRPEIHASGIGGCLTSMRNDRNMVWNYETETSKVRGSNCL